jgi:VWFA-related protein
VRLRLFTSSVFAVCLAAVIVAQSGTTPPPQEQRPTFRTDANFVRVDVYPTAAGRAVTDLSKGDFEVLEDGVVQAVETFEHVVIAPAGPQSLRSEPNTIAESRDMARNPRARVVILFLDVPHVTVHGTWNIREPLIRLLDRILGPDDLVGVMTPSMAASDIVLARKTEVMTGGLRDIWPWGERFTLAKTEIEHMYEECYPPTRGEIISALAKEMQERRRERATLDAFDELVRFLRDLRDERKAILTITEGWLLFRPNQALFDLRRDSLTGTQDPIPGVDPITVGVDGKLTTHDRRNNTSDYTRMDCERDRVALGHMDNDQYLRNLIDDANRGNSTFYLVDPRGLAVFDTPIGPDAPPPLDVDYRMLRARHEAMEVLALNTDGMVARTSNDLDRSMQKIGDDLTSYYLLGYYSTNGKPDGKFHGIKVRVKRPGVDVRARRGYRAASAEDVARAKKAEAAPVPESVSAVHRAIDALSRVRPEARLHINAVPQAAAPGAGVSSVWVAGEIDPSQNDIARTAEIEVSGGDVSGTASVSLAPGQRGFTTRVVLPRPAAPGPVDVRVRIAGGSGERTSDSISAALGEGLARPLLFRRGPSTGNRIQPAASFQFSRTERVRLEVPIDAGVTPGAARLLDKMGQPLAIPVTVTERTDADGGQRWLTADVTLAPLAPGDYAIELSATVAGAEQRVVTAIRVGR